MVRLVFRPYTQVRRSICTLESLRASTRVSPGFTLLRDSSPSFGSRQVCSHSNLSPEGSWSVGSAPCGSYLRSPELPSPSFRAVGFTQSTRTHVRLLGPCFKTGCREAFRQHRCKPRSRSRRDSPCTRRDGPLPQPKPILAHAQHISRSRGNEVLTTRTHCFTTIPFQQVQVLLTLFSKFFSSFPHGTCSLSVSHRYLALDGIYHPL